MADDNDDAVSFTIDDDDGNDYPSNVTTVAAAESTLSPSSLYYYCSCMDSDFVIQMIILKIVSLSSAFGSAYIIYDMVINVKDSNNRKKNLDRTFNRLLLCLCVSDFIASISFFLGSW